MSTRTRKRSAAHISTSASSSSSSSASAIAYTSSRADAHPTATASSSSSSHTLQGAGPSSKRRRTDNDDDDRDTPGDAGSSGQRPAPPRLPAEASIEEINLVDDEDPLSTTLQRQRAEQIREQSRAQAGGEEQESKLNGLSCAICLERPTDLAATSCGHLFCHECLFSSLVAGEKTANGESKKSCCPICRKTVSRKKPADVIPLAIMTKGVLKGKQRQRQQNAATSASAA